MQHLENSHHNLVAGTRFVHHGRTYRLDGFFCELQEAPLEHELLQGLFTEWDAEEAASLPTGMRRIKLRHCLPAEATFVSGSGLAGCVAAIEAIEVIGMVEWSEQKLAAHHEQALCKGREGCYAISIIRAITQSEEA